MNDTLKKLEAIVGEKRIRLEEPLTSHTIRKIPALAEMYLEIDKIDTLIKVIRFARTLNIPLYILGSGAKINVDNDIVGLVIKNTCRRFEKLGSKRGTNSIVSEDVLVYSEAGVVLNQIVRYTIDEGLEGLEYHLGLPGTVGGAIYTNAKYIPKYLLVNKALQSVTILNEQGELQVYSGKLPHFVYTDETWEETKDIIISAVFRLTPLDKKVLWKRGEEASAWREKQSTIGSGNNSWKE